MADDTVQVLGAANMRERVRTLKSGDKRSKFTVEISGDSLLINTDSGALTKPVAEAIGALLKERIQSITATVSPYTRKARKVARFAISRGEEWANKRYSGGKLGTRMPGAASEDRLFNDSGRMAESIAVTPNKTDGGFTINMAANRLDPRTLNGGVGALQRIWSRLVELVPELTDTRKLLDSIPIRKAISQSLKDAIVTAEERTVAAKRQLMQAKIQFARSFMSLVA